MLKHCASGYRAVQDPHHWRVMYLTHTAYLPLGKHGKRDNSETEVGHVKNMINLFDIKKCAGTQIERLR